MDCCKFALAILYKLHGESKLTEEGILDYLSYTTKVCQLVQRFILCLFYCMTKGTGNSSVLMIFVLMGHRCSPPPFSVFATPFTPVILLRREICFSCPDTHQSASSPLTLDGRVICKLYNTKGRCHYKESCKFAHQCSHPGCQQMHPAVTHAPSKKN